MEAAARQLEEEKAILKEFEQKSGDDEDFGLLSRIFSGTESDSYIPYGVISLESEKETYGCQSVLTSCSEINRPETMDASISSLLTSRSTTRFNTIAKVRFHARLKLCLFKCCSYTEGSLKKELIDVFTFAG